MSQLIARMRSWWISRGAEEDGATAVEYGMLVALVAAVIVTIIATLGGQINDAFQTVVDALP